MSDSLLDFIIDSLISGSIETAREDSLYFRVLDKGGAIAVYPLFYGHAQLALIVPPAGLIDDCYYYARAREAIDAAKAWHGIGEPAVGWYRHPPSGRRRVNGDPNQETVRS